MAKALLALLFAFGVTARNYVTDAAPVVLTGTAQDCYLGSKLAVRKLPVAAFDAASPTLENALALMDSIELSQPDSAAMARFSATYDRLVEFIRDSTALARDTTDASGSFSLAIAPVAGVIVIAERERGDEPFHFQYQKLAGRANASFMLDMSGERCGF